MRPTKAYDAWVVAGHDRSPSTAAPRPPRRAFTLLEVLFVVAIIGLLVSLLLPAIMVSRESARRHGCANNLCQLVVAMHNYAAANGVLPPGTIEPRGPILNRPVGYHIGWVPRILPFIERTDVYEQIDFSVGAYDSENVPMRRLHLRLFRCPSNTLWGYSYAGCHHDVEGPIDIDNHGVLFLNSLVRWRDIPDGRAQTIFLGERLDVGFELGWISGTRSTLRNTGTPINCTSKAGGPLATVVDMGVVGLQQVSSPKVVPATNYAVRPIWKFQGDGSLDDDSSPEHEYQPPPLADGTPGALVVGGFESQHSDGAQFAFGDGSVRFVSQDVDIVTYRRMGHRADGELIDERF